DIQAVPQHLIGSVAEQGFCGDVPALDNARAISIDTGLRAGGKNRFSDPVRGDLLLRHGLASFPMVLPIVVTTLSGNLRLSCSGAAWLNPDCPKTVAVDT